MKIPIEIDLSILDTYHLEDLELVYAVSELIDNSIGSFYRIREQFEGPLMIEIECNSEYFSIADNAAGISAEDFSNALILGKSNTKVKVTNDFGVYGVGLKRSILWIGRTTVFHSSSLSDKKSYALTYPQKDLEGKYLSETELLDRPYSGRSGLKIEVTNLHWDNVQGFNPDVIEKLKGNLGLIYHKFLESDEVFISINTQKLNVQKREILSDRLYDAYEETGLKQNGKKYCLVDHKAKKIEWRLPIEYANGDYKISGWLGIKKGASKSGIGIYVFREKRGILGIPPSIEYNPFNFKVGNFNYLRLIGEIEIYGFKKPTMGNALPEKNILDNLMHEYKQDFVFKRVKLDEELLYYFFKQLDHHRVDMIDSRPCQEKLAILTSVKESVKVIRESPMPYGYQGGKTRVFQSVISNSKEDFSFIIGVMRFDISVEQSIKNELDYSLEDGIFSISIKCGSSLQMPYLKLVAHYILLFDEANPILNRDVSELVNILPS